jgi:hypothetical protein
VNRVAVGIEVEGELVIPGRVHGGNVPVGGSCADRLPGRSGRAL